MPPIEVTALVVTYNHAPFIEKAIESVLMQETDFDYEIIISEDYSTDGTREIVRRLAEAHPDRIRLLLSERNRNDNVVIRRGLEAARGRYVALLDGDDLWTSKQKLQKQVDFLDAHPECSICFHNANVVYEDGNIVSHPFHEDEPSQRLSCAKPKPVSTLADIVRGNFIPTCSVVFRTEPSRHLPDWYDDQAFGDWSLHVLNAEHGDVAYLDEVMATYRVHSAGIWSMKQSEYRHLEDVTAIVDAYDLFNRHLALAFDAEVNTAVADLYEGAAYWFYKAGQHHWASTCAWRSLTRRSAEGRARRWKLIGVLAIAGFRQLGPKRAERGSTNA